jgi:hypothetical protein
VELGVGYVKKNFLRGLELSEFSAIQSAAQVWLDTIANVRIHGETNQRPSPTRLFLMLSRVLVMTDLPKWQGVHQPLDRKPVNVASHVKMARSLKVLDATLRKIELTDTAD